MATKIVTKNSSTASAVPTASDLVQGELAVNVADKRLFTEDNGGSIVELGTNPSTLTVTGAITANAGVVVDNFTLDGTTLSLSSGNMTLDVAGNIILDSDAGQVVLADGGSNKGLLKLNGDNLEIKTEISNADMKFNGNDGGSAITALTLDMSNAGKATFNSGADFGADTQVTGIMSLYSTHLGAVIGSIGNTANDLNIYSTTSGHNGLRFHVNGILPTDNAGTIIDNDADLGDTSYRFKDLHLSGSIKNTSDITLDAAGDIILDADGADVILKDGGTGFLEIDKDGDNARLKNPIADGDIKIQGIDGASTITALTLDMSNAGAATFNAGATIQTASNEEDALLIKQSDGTDVGSLRINNGSFLLKGKSASQPVQIQSHDGNEDIEIDPDGFIKFETAGSERLRIDSSGNVGIGTSSPAQLLHVQAGSTGNGTIRVGGGAGLEISHDNSGNTVQRIDSLYRTTTANANLQLRTGFLTVHTGTSSTERMRIDSVGNLLVGKTSTTFNTAGIALRSADVLQVTRSGNTALELNRTTNDGKLAEFYKDGASVGSIGTSGDELYIGKGDTTLLFNESSDAVLPRGTNGAARDNAIDLGSGSNRFDDIYATNGTIQTSDFNEKQDIAELSEAEQRVAVAAKGLLRKFRWKDSVAEKGDDARIHFGIIAQDLQAAFEAEGLDAGDYAMFISTTWTDEETNEEKTRIGVRYSELLAFIISAI